ncbi:MAG: hypothetical protein WCB61_04735, partial [Pseudolabrys sp.]
TTIGAGVSIQRLVLSVPAPGILTTVLKELAHVCLWHWPIRFGGLRSQRPETVPPPLLAQAPLSISKQLWLAP